MDLGGKVEEHGSFPDAESPSETKTHARRPITKSQKLLQVQNLFTESQKIAYVGLCYLSIMHYMRQKLAKGKIKQFKHAYEAYTAWSNTFLQRIYLYIDINPKEIEMIKHLADHGVLPHDLASSVLQESAELEKRNLKQQAMAVAESSSESQGLSASSAIEISDQGQEPNASSTRVSTPEQSVTGTSKKVHEPYAAGEVKETVCESLVGTAGQRGVPEVNPSSYKSEYNKSSAIGSDAVALDDNELDKISINGVAQPKLADLGIDGVTSAASGDGSDSTSCPTSLKVSNEDLHFSNCEQMKKEQLESENPDLTLNIADIAILDENKSAVADDLPPSSAVAEATAAPTPVRTTSLVYESKLLPGDPRVTILSHLFLLCITDGTYTAYERSLLRVVAEHLDIAPEDLFILERILTLEVRMYEDDLVEKDVSAIEAQAKREQRRKWALMGLATVGGGLVIGLTAGLAAPFIGAGVATALGAMGVTGTSAALTSVGAVAFITTGGVLTGSGMSGYHMARRTADIKEFEFIQNPPGKGQEKYYPCDDVRYIEWEEREKERKRQEKLAKRQALAAAKEGSTATCASPSVASSARPDFSSSNERLSSEKVDHDANSSYESLHDSSSVEETPNSANSSFLELGTADSSTLNLPSSPCGSTESAGASAHTSIQFVANADVVNAQDTEENKARPPSVIISISGWATNGVEDFWEPFSVLSPIYGDHYSLVWESKALAELGSALAMFATELLSFGVQQIIGATLLPVLMGALTGPLWALKLSYFVDNPWGVGLTKARKAGEILAETLMKNVQCGRPVTLIGFSLGARVIFYCLEKLYEKRAFGLVEEVYLFGTPVSASKSQWVAITSVVTGKIVNGFTTQDWLLGVVYRTGNWGLVAGLSEIQGVPGIDNVDLTRVVQGHLGYRLAMPRILKMCGLKVTSEILPEEEERLAREAEKKQQQEKADKAKQGSDEGPRSSSTSSPTLATLSVDPNLPETGGQQAVAAGDVEKILQKLTDAGADGGEIQGSANLESRAPKARIGRQEQAELCGKADKGVTLASPELQGKKAPSRKTSFWWFGSSASGDQETDSPNNAGSPKGATVIAGESIPEFTPKEIKSTLPPLVMSSNKVSDDSETLAKGIELPAPVLPTLRRHSESTFGSDHGPPINARTGFKG